MGLRLVKPMARSDSSKGQFVQRIPVDLKDQLVGLTLEFPVAGEITPITVTDKMQSIRFSLRTSDLGEIKRRQGEAIAYLEGVYRNLRANAPITLTHRQCVALAGELYRSWAADLEASSGRMTLQNEADGSVTRIYEIDLEVEAAGLANEADKMEQLDGADLEAKLGPLVGRLLLRRGIVAVDRASREMLLPEFAKALAEGMRARSRKAQSDYRPDPNSERFPAWSAPEIGRETRSTSVATPAHVSLRGLFDAWWIEAENAGRSVSTKESFKTPIERLVEFLEHDDAAKVTQSDVQRFKEHLLTAINPRTKKPLTAKTIKDNYLVALNGVFAWAVANKRISANPVEGVTMKAGKKRKVRAPWFTPGEIKALLEQASAATPRPREPRQRFDGRRWVPWLCAYTGARVGEMVQLRKQDVRPEIGLSRDGSTSEDGRWILAITPDAITVKGGEGREVPVHPHLVEMGFIEFVQAAPDGFLFLWSGKDRSAWRTAKNRMVEEARNAVPDPNVAPNHGWRHTFKVIAGDAGISERIQDAICGHAPRTIGETYGGVTMAAKAKALEQFPRFDAKPIAAV
ncbi:MAG: phage integrase SAM-like domain-containing protein [Mesorhizobium sp.]